MRRLLIAAFWGTMLLVSVLALLPKPPRLPLDPSDLLQHFAAFVTLTALALAAYPRASARSLFLGLVAFGGLIELFQLIPMLNRDAAWLDWIVDCAAVLIVLAIGSRSRRAVAARVRRAS